MDQLVKRQKNLRKIQRGSIVTQLLIYIDNETSQWST